MNTLPPEQIKKQNHLIKFLGNSVVKDRIALELDELYYDKYNMIFCYKYYIIQIYGSEVWLDLLENKKFKRLFYYSIKVYGNEIIEALVDISVTHLNLPTSTILLEFSKYVETIENIENQELAQFT